MDYIQSNVFSKSHYYSHKKLKAPCKNNAHKIKELVDKAVEEKITELKVIVNINLINEISGNDCNKMQKPFLKWVGGKTQIIDKIIKKFPKEINNYHELFLGGGSVLLALLSLQASQKIIIKNKIYAYDINKALIYVYKHIQEHKDELYNYIEKYITDYDSINNTITYDNISKEEEKRKKKIIRNPVTLEDAKKYKESYYYWLRNTYNDSVDKTTIKCAALFMVLNKTCFRGMYREGPNGFNVPYGHYKKTPTIITKENLTIISELIKDVEFIHADFSISIKAPLSGDFVYLDPPYAPINDDSFVGYVSGGFGLDKHKQLFSSIKEFNTNKIKFAMSNANVKLVIDSFAGYKCDNIIVRRAINSKNPGSTAKELIIYN